MKKSGSAPCLAGAKMIARRDGTFVASVGGGALEIDRDGISEADLGRVHCPIGIDIKAETQVEIAFSVVSQLILARARS